MIINDLPVEIIENILLYLDVHDQIRLQCVCKLWLSLINNETFWNIKLYKSLNKIRQLDNKKHLRIDEIKFEKHYNIKPNVLPILKLNRPYEYAIWRLSQDIVVCGSERYKSVYLCAIKALKLNDKYLISYFYKILLSKLNKCGLNKLSPLYQYQNDYYELFYVSAQFGDDKMLDLFDYDDNIILIEKGLIGSCKGGCHKYVLKFLNLRAKYLTRIAVPVNSNTIDSSFKFAVKNKYIDIINLLLSQKIDNYSGLLVSLQYKNYNLINFFYSQIIKTDGIIKRSDLCIFNAAKSGEQSLVKLIISSVDEYSINTNFINSGLKGACYSGNETLVSFFLNMGADCFNEGIMYAAKKGHIHIINYLSNICADRNFKFYLNNSLYYTCAKDYLVVTMKLLSIGGNDLLGSLRSACRKGSTQTIIFFLHVINTKLLGSKIKNLSNKSIKTPTNKKEKISESMLTNVDVINIVTNTIDEYYLDITQLDEYYNHIAPFTSKSGQYDISELLSILNNNIQSSL